MMITRSTCFSKIFVAVLCVILTAFHPTNIVVVEAQASSCETSFATCVAEQSDCDPSCVDLVPTCTTLPNLAESAITAQGYVCDCFFQGRCDAGDRCCPACDEELVETLECYAKEVQTDCTFPFTVNWCDTAFTADASGSNNAVISTSLANSSQAMFLLVLMSVGVYMIQT